MAATVVASASSPDFSSFTVPLLKDYLSKRGVSVTGYIKAQLVELSVCVDKLSLPVDPDCTSNNTKTAIQGKWERVGCKKNPASLCYSDDFTHSPQFSLLDLFNYLICSRSDYDRRGLAAYKSFEDYKLHFDGHVSSVTFCYLSANECTRPLCAYSAEVLPAQRDRTYLKKKTYTVWVLVDPEAVEVRAAHCECIGG